MTAPKLPDNVFPIKTFIHDLPPHFIPQPQQQEQQQQPSPDNVSAKRLIIIGDVHGMRNSLSTLLTKLSFNKDAGDHLILTGDLINKGPDSGGVIDLAIQHGASAVRGNHDNAVLNAHAEIQSAVSSSGTFQIPEKYKDSPVNKYTTAMALSEGQREWLAGLPLMIRVRIPEAGSGCFAGTKRVVVVHAGLVPGLELEGQDAHAVMHLRSLVPAATLSRDGDGDSSGNSEDENPFKPAEDHGEESWVGQWDQYQETQPSKTAVVFGHDAKRRLQLGKYATGLDSGCLYGGQLSALVIELSEDGTELVKSIVQVECADEPVAPKEKRKDKVENILGDEPVFPATVI
ncbi:Metallo-dependent phosphatase-like protein [Aspergillus heterothallicus]